MKETKTVSDLITTATETAAVAIRPESLKMKRRLTMEATSLVRLKHVICRIDGEFEKITMPGLNVDGSRQQATAIPITDVISNTQYLLICNTQMVSGITRAGTPSLGRYFAMKAGEIKAGKRYRQMEVFELEVAE